MTERANRLTIVLQKLLYEVYMRQDHTAAAITLKLQFCKSITKIDSLTISNKVEHRGNKEANPSGMVSSSFRYAVHLSPTTLPHEKQRTGII
jgi:hypothetical protein